jgi:DinB superfamily
MSSAPRISRSRPESSEYAPYYESYIRLVSTDDIVSTPETQRVQTVQLLSVRSEREGNFRYAPGKWTVKEIIGHLTDTERIFAYRALRIARADATPLSGFEQDDYVRSGNFDARTLQDLAGEFDAVRAASVHLFGSLSDEAWLRRGTANNVEVSVRALAFITAGHELHHRRILEERYFSAIPRA